MPRAEIPENVLKYLQWCSKEVGKYSEDSFNCDLWNSFTDQIISSPIEQLLYTSMRAFCVFNNIDLKDFDENYGTTLDPQYKINKYTVDFLIRHWLKTPKTDIENKVVVECDGHDFHDKNEKQRRYEKQRDRFLQSIGYKVIHFTGSEVYSDPMRCAKECMCLVMGWEQDRDFIQLDSNILD